MFGTIGPMLAGAGLALVVCPGPIHGQTVADTNAVRRAVLDYVEGFYEGDTAKLVRSVRADVLKLGFGRRGESTTWIETHMSWEEFLEYARDVREENEQAPADAPKIVELLDAQAVTASAKLTASWGTDYLLIGKFGGRWMISHVLWQSPPPSSSVDPAVSDSRGSAYAFLQDQPAPDRTFARIANTSGNRPLIDGRLDDAVWRMAPAITEFSEFEPHNLARPPVRTEARLAFDEGHLYVAIRARDAPVAIRAAARDRDEMWEDDHAGILLDPYGDALAVYGFYTSAAGVQGDIRFERSEANHGYDAVFESAAMMIDDGYVIEMAIPFGAMRFPPEGRQRWRFTVWRHHPRDLVRSYTSSAIARDDPCWLCQLEPLEGMSGIGLQHRTELLPALVATSATSSGGGRPVQNSRSVDAGIGVRRRLTPELAAEVVLNPDFSQVEADESRIDVNTPFALSFPERRPFFQDGAELLTDPLETQYTRSINDPILAAKIVGRVSQTDVLYVAARDARTPMLVPLAERTLIALAGESTSQMLRARRSFGDGAYVGVSVTDRRLPSGADHLIAMDGTQRFSRNIQFVWQVALSRTREPDDSTLLDDSGGDVFDSGRYTVSFDGERFAGRGIYALLARDARPWSFELGYLELSPSLRFGNGFQERNDLRIAFVEHGLEWSPNGRVLDRIETQASVERHWSFGGGHRLDRMEVGLELDLTGQTGVEIEAARQSEWYAGVWFAGVDRMEVELRSAPVDYLSLAMTAAFGEAIARNETSPVLGKGFELEASASARLPWDLALESAIALARLDGPEGRTIFRGWVGRTRVSLTPVAPVTIRITSEYDSFDRSFRAQPLLSCRLAPLSVLFVGAVFQQHPVLGEHAARERQVFIKLRHLIRS